MLVGEAPGENEVEKGEPFVGFSGMLLDEMLNVTGLKRSEIFLTNVARERPPSNKIGTFFLNPDPKGNLRKPTKTRPNPTWEPGPHILAGIAKLKEEVARVQPNVIVPMGAVALWAIEGSQQIGKWRGSLLTSKPEFGSRKVIPAYHPAYILRAMGDRPYLQADLHRVSQQQGFAEIVKPTWNIRVRPSLAQVWEAIWQCYRAKTFSADIETRGYQISCLGLAWSKTDAICIPFMDSKRGDGCYWTEEEECLVWQWIEWLFRQPEVELVGQNWPYDASYFIARRGFFPKATWDTMDMMHVLYAGMEKSLHMIASQYCEYYRFWKDDGRDWDTSMPEEQHWLYCGEDCLRTLECKDELEWRLRDKGLMHLYRWRQDHLSEALMMASTRGIKVNKDRQGQVVLELQEFAINTLGQLEYILGHPFNPKSPQQCATLLYEDFGATPIINRKTGMITTDDGALDRIALRTPILTPLILRMKDYRSATTLSSNMGLVDADGRMRFNLNIGGAETYRLSSSGNNFGTGMNGQNITKGDEEEDHDPGRLVVPNLRTMFVPDPGYTLADIDLKRADLVVVAKEARDEVLLQQLAEGFNPYLFASAEYLKCSPEEVEAKHGTRYTQMKSFFHGTNYCGTPRTMAANCGMLVSESEALQRWWFGRHPGIKDYHERTKAQLIGRREIRNAFGYRRYYFDRPDAVLSQAVAWLPQSTVAIVSLMQFVNIFERVPRAQLLLQVHDSLLLQYPTHLEEEVLREIFPHLIIEIPYKDKPLILNPTLSTSTVSWGVVKKRSWPS